MSVDGIEKTSTGAQTSENIHFGYVFWKVLSSGLLAEVCS